MQQHFQCLQTRWVCVFSRHCFYSDPPVLLRAAFLEVGRKGGGTAGEQSEEHSWADLARAGIKIQKVR